uniref:Isopenicillin N synthase n=1 Tax=Tanacetum cinerariifolium TaxID=118510 RepID=A0A6L2P551_TANCI|nr:isopenicillin N synthase [Tanacetum cinerariifolium]
MLSETENQLIPTRYVKPLPERPSFNKGDLGDINIPLIDLFDLANGDSQAKKAVMDQISVACREWGFFQVVNHGMSSHLVDEAREVWREFFHQPMELKQEYANTPKTYEGYVAFTTTFVTKCDRRVLGRDCKARQGVVEDPGGMTFLLPDEHVSGLQVRKGDEWITVKPARHAIIVNIGDQIQYL